MGKMVNMRISIIEIGTNSTKYIVAKNSQGCGFEIVNKFSTINRLSSGMYPDMVLTKAAIDNELTIIRDLICQSNLNSAPLGAIISTSVLRDATNKHLLINRVKEEFGFDIEIIDGRQEALLAYLACRSLCKGDFQKSAVIDIGGGSTEITIGMGNEICGAYSLDIGAVRLKEMLDSNAAQVNKYVRALLSQKEDINLNGLKLIGTGGTIKSLGTIFYQAGYSQEQLVNGKCLSYQNINVIYNMLLRLNLDERSKLKGLHPKRADVIVFGTGILLAIMQYYCINEITICSAGVLEGYLQQYFHHRIDREGQKNVCH